LDFGVDPHFRGEYKERDILATGISMGVEPSEGQRRLIETVIRGGICVNCGACVGLCPYFDYHDGRVVVMDRCSADTWRCLQMCPRAGYQDTALSPVKEGPDTEGIGYPRSIWMARAKSAAVRERAQYGGVVSALLISALEKGQVGSAALTDSGGSMAPGGRLVRNRSGVLSCAGSRYSAAGGLSVLNRALAAGEKDLAVVGLPCQMEALARMRLLEPDGEERSGAIALRIGLFCTWALDYRRMERFLAETGLEGPILKFDIPPPPEEVFRVHTAKGWREIPLSEIRPMIQEGCTLCEDMTALCADLSVGSVEGQAGWNTVIVRTEPGERVINAAVDSGDIEVDHLPDANLAHLREAALNKRARAQRRKTESVKGRI